MHYTYFNGEDDETNWKIILTRRFTKEAYALF